MNIIILGKEFELKSKLIREGVKFPFADEEDKTLHNKFKVSITRIFGNGKKKTKRFNFYDSHANYEKGVKNLSENNLKWAFRCFVEDARCGSLPFSEFCEELGYDKDSRRAHKIYKECMKSLDKILNLGVHEYELNDMIDAFSDMGIV